MAEPTGFELNRLAAWMRGGLENTPKGMNPDVANMVRDVRNMYMPAGERPVGAGPAMQSAVQGQPLPAASEPVRQVPGMRTLAQGVAPQGPARGYSGMAWEAPKFSEIAGLGPQSATPDLSQIYNSPVGPKRAAPAVSDMTAKMGQPPKAPGFWDAATMGGGPQTTAGTTPMEELGILGKLAGAARGLSTVARGLPAAGELVTGPVGVTTAMAPLAAYFGQKELPASYERGHASMLPPATRAPDQTGGTPFAAAFDKFRQTPDTTSAPQAPTATARAPATTTPTPGAPANTVNVYRPNTGWTTYDVSQGAPIGKIVGQSSLSDAMQRQQIQAMDTYNRALSEAVGKQMSPNRAKVIGTVGAAEPNVSYPSLGTAAKPVPATDRAIDQSLAVENQLSGLDTAFEEAVQKAATDNPNLTPEQIAALPAIKQIRSRQQRLQERLNRLTEITSKKLPTLDQVMGLKERGE